MYAGHHIEGTGAWVLQDSLFTPLQFCQIFKDEDFANSLQKIASVQQDRTLSMFGCTGNGWSLACKSSHVKTCGLDVRVLDQECDDMSGDASSFVEYVAPLYNERSTKELLPSSEVVG